jgi:hypothetical protein
MWAAMALLVGTMLLLSANHNNSGPNVRPLGSAKLLAAIPTTITIDSFDSGTTTFTGTVTSNDPSCQDLQPVTLALQNPGSIPVAGNGTATTDNNGAYTSTPTGASSGDTYVASIPSHPTVPPSSDSCPGATSAPFTIP